MFTICRKQFRLPKNGCKSQKLASKLTLKKWNRNFCLQHSFRRNGINFSDVLLVVRLATSRPLGERSEPFLAAKRPTASDELARGPAPYKIRRRTFWKSSWLFTTYKKFPENPVGTVKRDWFEQTVNLIDFGTKFTSLEFCLPFTYSVNRPVCIVNGKQPLLPEIFRRNDQPEFQESVGK